MKRVLLFIFALSVVGGVKAKQKITTLWEETYTGAIELNAATVGTFIEGDVLRIYLTLSVAGNFGISYKSEGNGWTDKAIPSINNMWPWISTTGETYYDVTFTSADITALSGQNIYIAEGGHSTPTKVELRHTLTPSATTNISTDSYTADWGGKQYSGVEAAKIGDVIKFTYTATGTYFQMYVMNYAKGEDFKTDAYAVTNGDSYTYEYIIPDYTTLKKIREEGFSIKGDAYQITSVDLLTYSDSYGYTSITIGDTGYATWSSTKKYDFKTAGITAYYASNVTNGSVTLTPMDITWDYQGYILKATPGDYDVMESLTTDGTYYPSTNYLKQQVSSGSVAASVTGTYHYIFAKNSSSVIGFYKLTSDHTLAANKAYLETATDITPISSARIALIFDDDETTGVNEVRDLNTNVRDGYYDLQGRKVAQPTRGLYIVNGRKVIIK